MNLSIAMFVFGALVGLLLWQLWRSRRLLPQSYPQRSAVSNAGRVNGTTQRQLVRLLNGDQRTANRLVSQAKVRYPGQSEQWYWEKVIFDLERDRHLY